MHRRGPRLRHRQDQNADCAKDLEDSCTTQCYIIDIMPKKESETKLRKEFDRQVENLIQKGYSKVIGVTPEEFMKHLKPLKERIGELAIQESDAEG